ncbi:MAG: molybdopterin-dependent oxidoreductase [Desulfosalsimonas sp.]
MDRRTFLKLAGMGSLAFASACTLENEKNLYSLVRLEDDMVPGRASWYASTCRQCPAGCGVLAKNREGRVVKLEGNPLHPVNKGKLCIRGQAALQEVFHPDRLKKPQIRENNTWKTIGYEQALALVAEKTKAAAAREENRVRMITQLEGDMRLDVFKKALASANSAEPLVFEPFSFEKIRAANQEVFGVNAIASWQIRDADFLLGFGADFCETWLSPVQYAREFKTMHAWQGAAKGRFFHVSPWRGITGANADCWLSCAPGTEAAVCLGLIRRVMEQKPPQNIPARTAKAIRAVSDPFDANQVTAISGIDPDAWQRLAAALSEAGNPLVLGGPATAADAHDLQTELAVNLLNYLLDPNLEKMDFTRPHRVQQAASHLQILDFFDELGAGSADVVLLNQVNPVYFLGPGIKERLDQTGAFVVSFSNFMDETAQCADLVFPTSLALESWDEYSAYPDLPKRKSSPPFACAAKLSGF